jgi:hypothetical protein
MSTRPAVDAMAGRRPMLAHVVHASHRSAAVPAPGVLRVTAYPPAESGKLSHGEKAKAIERAGPVLVRRINQNRASLASGRFDARQCFDRSAILLAMDAVYDTHPDIAPIERNTLFADALTATATSGRVTEGTLFAAVQTAEASRLATVPRQSIRATHLTVVPPPKRFDSNVAGVRVRVSSGLSRAGEHIPAERVEDRTSRGRAAGPRRHRGDRSR